MNKCKQYRFSVVQRGLSVLFALLLTVGLLSVPALADAPVGSYLAPTSTSVNYYSYNGSSLSSLGLLSMYSSYLVTGGQTISGVEFYQITVNGVSAYVKASNMQVAAAAQPAVPATADTTQAVPASNSASATTATTGSGQAIGTVRITPKGTTNMRAEAHMLSGNIIAKIKQGTTLPFFATVVPPSGNHVWYYCYDAASGQYGYIVDDCVEVLSISSGATIAQLPDASSLAGAPTANPLYSNSTAVGYIRIRPTGKTNIRSSTKTDSNNVVAQAEQNDILPYYAVSVVNGTTWYYVYYQPAAAFGYVVGSCAEITNSSAATTVATVVPGATAVPVSFTNQAIGTIQFTAGGVNLRKSPSTSAKVAGRFEKGETTAYYGVTAGSGTTWYQVMKDGEIGYVMSDFCLVVSGNNAAGQPSSSPAVSGYVMTTSDKVYVRKKASTTAGTYGQIAQAGTVLPLAGSAVISGAVTWYPVSYNGNIGYVHGSYASLLNSDQAAAYQNGQPLPTATPAPTSAPVPVSYIQTTTDKVWIRKSPSTAASTKGQALLGAVFHFTGTTRSGGVDWYKIDYAGETCYIMAKYCRVMTNVEYAAYQGSVPADNSGGGAASVPGDQSNMAVTTMDKVIVRAEGRSGGKQIALLYRAGQVCTLLGNTNVANNYTWYNVNVNGVTGWIRGDLLRILTTAEAQAYSASGSANSGSGSGSSVNGVTLYKPELIDWYTGGIQDIFYRGCVAILTDVRTGISFQIKRWAGGVHADVEPLTAADTAAMCRVYGVSTAQQISDKNLYQRRPVLITIGNHSYAASIYGVPHNYPEGDTIPNNNFNGQFCVHFVNSRVHNSNKVDKDHQNAIMYAYENAARILGIN